MHTFKVSKMENNRIVEFIEPDYLNEDEMMDLIGIFKESKNNREKLIFKLNDGYIKQKLIGLRFHKMGVSFEKLED